jgi:hypothetical protein
VIPRLIGGAGFAGVGKDTLGDALVQGLGYIKFSFSDALYLEVSAAFDIPIEHLRDRAHKERKTDLLGLRRCRDHGFVGRMMTGVGQEFRAAQSPRDILQWWGTEYRREQDPDYWVKRARDFYHQQLEAGASGLVNCSVRFVNEAQWVREEGGAVVRIQRPGVGAVNAHVSDKPLPAEYVTAEIVNDGRPEDLLGKLLKALETAEAA